MAAGAAVADEAVRACDRRARARDERVALVRGDPRGGVDEAPFARIVLVITGIVAPVAQAPASSRLLVA